MTVERNPKLDSVLTAPPKEAWQIIFEKLSEIFSAPLTPQHVEQDVTEREHKVSELELLLSSSAWELWHEFETSVPHTGIPSDTTPFAKALGFGQRSSINNKGAGLAHHLPGARTESLNVAWDYCLDWIASSPAIVLWHHWPDELIHQLAEPGDGFQKLCREAAQQLTSDSFWKMIERMTTGRRLVIISDHGYAASGMFTDVANKEQANWLKTNFGSSRFAHGPGTAHHWLPCSMYGTSHSQNMAKVSKRSLSFGRR